MQDGGSALRRPLPRGDVGEVLVVAQRLAVLQGLQQVTNRLPAVEDAVLARLTTDTAPTELGSARWRDVLTTRLRISRKEATRRLARAV